MKKILNNKKVRNIMKKGTTLALAAAFLVNASSAYAATMGEPSGKNVKFDKNCYYNRTVEYTGTRCYVGIKLFKNATTVSEYTTNPQPLSIEGDVYYLDGELKKRKVSLDVTDYRQTTLVGKSVPAPSNHKFVSGNATFLVAGSQQGKTLEWNN